MKTPIENIQPDEGCSFRLLKHKVTADTYQWNYHYHPEIELVYVFNGIGKRHVGNHLSYYTDGDLVLIGPHLPHSGFGYGSTDIHEEIVLQFRYDFLGEDIWKRPEMSKIDTLLRKSQYGICFYGQTKERIGKMLKEMPKLSPNQRLILLLNIFSDLADSEEYILLNEVSQSFGFNHKDQNRLKNIYEYVEQNFMNTIDINEVASISNLSVPAFCNYFKKMINMTYTDFVNEYRINKACQMLVTDKSIVDICFENGFSNQSYFSKVFKKVKGKSPMTFRKELINRA